MKSISKIKVLVAATFASFAACGAEVVIDPGVGVEMSPEKISGTTDVTIKSGIVTMDPANDYTGKTTVSNGTLIATKAAAAGSASSVGASGDIDIMNGVFRYDGEAGATLGHAVISSTPEADRESSVACLDIRKDLVLTSLDTGYSPTVKIGDGAMILEGASSSTTFKFMSKSNNNGINNHTTKFELPADGTAPSSGLSTVAFLGGKVILNKGNATVLQTNKRTILGGWTAGEGEKESDFEFIVNSGTATVSTRQILGQLHGLKDFNTPDGPAKAWVTVNSGATYNPAGGQAFTMGSEAVAPKVDDIQRYFNTDLKIEINGGSFTHESSYAGFQVYQRPGQVNRILMDGGTFLDRVVEVGGGVTSGDATATLLVDMKNGAKLYNGKWFNNTAKVASQPAVQVNITGGSAFYTQLLKPSDATKPGNMSIYIDNGTFGVYNATLDNASHKDLWVQRKLIAPAGLVKLELGEGGATLIAQGTSVTDTLPNTAVYEKGFSTAETLVTAGKKDGGLTITGQTVDHVVELSGASTYTGPTVLKSGTLLLTGDGDISSSEAVTVKNNANLLVAEKDVTLANAVFETGAILTVWKGHKLIITGTVEFKAGVNIVLLNEDGTEVTDAAEF